MKLSTTERKHLVYLHMKKGMTYKAACDQVDLDEIEMTKNHKLAKNREEYKENYERYRLEATRQKTPILEPSKGIVSDYSKKKTLLDKAMAKLMAPAKRKKQ